jgi:phosphoribosylformimino-5-aminoimidazole carboxamide ribotide isomerase
VKKTFSVIPVMDLLGGQVVHAVRGHRQAYQPLRSNLCEGSEPVEIVKALLDFVAFDRFYIADLAAIQNLGSHRELILQLSAKYPNVQWWIDDGSALPWQNKPHNVLQVLGTESYPKLSEFTENFALSLDERDGLALGDVKLHHSNEQWPKAIIAMTLSQVGADCGPNYSQINRYITQYPENDWYAAGGVRHVQDLAQLKVQGASGALIATALHKGRIAAHEIEALSQTG